MGRMYKRSRHGKTSYRYGGRRIKRRKKPNRTSLVVSMGRQIFPKSFMTKHRYSVTESILPGTSTPDAVYYSCNGIYDVEAAVGGHSALGFDQLTPIYDHYTVVGSKITIRAMSAANDVGTGGVIVGCYVNDDTTAITTYDTILEQGGAVSKILGPRDGKSNITLKKSFSTKAFFGVTDVKDNQDLKGNATANPSDGAWYVVFAQGIDPASNPGNIYINVLIEYITIWTEPRSLSQS